MWHDTKQKNCVMKIDSWHLQSGEPLRDKARDSSAFTYSTCIWFAMISPHLCCWYLISFVVEYWPLQLPWHWNVLVVSFFLRLSYSSVARLHPYPAPCYGTAPIPSTDRTMGSAWKIRTACPRRHARPEVTPAVKVVHRPKKWVFKKVSFWVKVSIEFVACCRRERKCV